MKTQFFIFIQYLLPKRYLSLMFGKLANVSTPWVKNLFIKVFIKLYPEIDMNAAIEENPYAYTCFNHFFTRQLKTNLRVVSADPNHIVSPVDGLLTQYGNIHEQQLLQAKGFYFDVYSLLGGNADDAIGFHNGKFATFYLAPYHYHRVHMPCDASLHKAIYIPGEFFSVNKVTASAIPKLYSRNERLVIFFATPYGPMAIILVGAMLVGSIKTSFDMPSFHTLSTFFPKTDLSFKKGDEIGHFAMGSTVILLFPKQVMEWEINDQMIDNISMGQTIGRYLNSVKN